MTIWQRLSGLVTLRLSAVLTLIALALMVWSMLEPTPLPVMLAMSAGQGIGILAFGIYLFIVVRELVRELRRARQREPS
ncbi:MAG TPA: hypothetical protein VK607_17795 [Kofleriaceae bacterium]|nr:hypothetical protein [Kofleriaceae bacterium]